MFRVIVKIVLLFLLCCQTTLSATISNEKKALVDELIVLQGANFIGEEIALAMASDFEQMLELNGVTMKEDFYESVVSIVSELVFEQFVATGELAELYYETWGSSLDAKEILALIAFYESPAGRKLVEVAPSIERRIAEAVMKLGDSIRPNLEERFIQRFGASSGATNGLDSLIIDSIKPANLISMSQQPSVIELTNLIEQKCRDVDIKDEKERTPVYRPLPIYPQVAAEHGLHGSVDLLFQINEDGSTSNVRVEKSSNGTLFDAAALNAASKYRYCPGGVSTDTQVRVLFEMEGQSVNRREVALSSTKISNPLGFLQAELFRNELKDYLPQVSRKAFAVASDDTDSWAGYFSYGHRTQNAANERALELCSEERRAHRVNNVCELVLIGNTLTDKFSSSTDIVDLVALLAEKDYKPKSIYEQYVDEYLSKYEAKALAMVIEPDGAYYLAYSSGVQTQAESNRRAIDICDKNKPKNYRNPCTLYMIGQYLVKDVPKLNKLKGMWLGEITDQLVGEKDDSTTLQPLQLRLDNCGIAPILAMRESKDQEFTDLAGVLQVTEAGGNVVLSSLREGDSWVETQLWSFIDLQNDTLKVQQNRMVSNVGLSLDDPQREFGYLGSGSLTKLDNGCGDKAL